MFYYKKLTDGSYKKVTLVEQVVNGYLQFVDQDIILRGYKGETGVDGYTPIKGVDYFDGLRGEDGLQGIQGPIGLSGKDGYTPIKGIDYFDGLQGVPGIQGPIGLKGDKGETGVDGYTPIKGIDYFDGLQGVPGIQGPIGLSGKDGYTPIKGRDYFDGLQGVQGIQGPIGPRGFVGERGATGSRGATGPRGLQGERGERGFPGVGIQGPPGPTGPAGSGGGSASYSEVKVGVVSGASFSGTQLSYSVVFDSDFGSITYAISIVGEDPRTWSISNKTVSGFDIISNSSEPFTGSVNWITSYGSGSIQSNNRRGVIPTTAWYDSVKKCDILFADPLSTTYSVVIGGEDPRTWSVGNKTLTGFTIYSNSSESLEGITSYQCIEV